MTENEALKLGKSLYDNITSNVNNIIPTKEYIEFVGMAIIALSEIQPYRAIGTVEELQALKEFKKTITEIVNSQLIAGKNNYKEIYDCFQKIAKAVQDNY